MNRNRKGFTLIELLIVVVIVGILALAAIPLITSNTRDARRAEGEQLMGAARDFARVQFSKTGSGTDAETAFATEQATGAFSGNYFEVTTLNTGADNSTTETNDVNAVPSNASDGTGEMTFAWGSGVSTITWT